jgi:UDP-2,4-diacetamido-2,4,6-trideoxy-beta-L-altropyranose hydrolase
MQVAFRVDASPQIGTGHVVRCLTLADALRGAGVRTRLVSRHITPALAEMAHDSGHDLKNLPALVTPVDPSPAHAEWLGTSQDADAEATRQALAGEEWDWLIVDHYALDARWEERLRPSVRRILAVDDLADRPHACDALLDQNLQVAPDRYNGLLPDQCRALLGPSYALLRPEFRDVDPRPASGEIHRINIFFGGFDATGMTLRALDEIAPLLAAGIAVDVVVGAGTPRQDDIRVRCAALGAVLHVQTREMARLFAEADLAIGAGGATSWERCRMAVPALVVSVAENQRAGCRALAEAGAAVSLGDVGALARGAIRAAVEKLVAEPATLQAMRRRSAALVDGRGTERVMLYLMRDQTGLRPARQDDARRALSWRNHPLTRQFSVENAELEWEDHRDWWESSLAADHRNLLIAHCGGIDFGVLRFDRHGDRATVSIYLDPSLNGLGLGSAVLRAGHAWIGLNSAIKTLDARILRVNQQSQRSFAAAGYRQIADEDWARPVERRVKETEQ